MKGIRRILFWIAVVFLVGCQKQEDQIIKLNDIVIGQEQMGIYMQRCRSGIISQYQESGEKIDDQFWKKQTKDGTTVEEKQKEEAKEECFYDQMLLCVAKEKGLIKSDSFADVKAEMQKENERRKEALENDQVVYGTKEYSLDTYVSYYIDNLTKKLKDTLKKEEIATTDEAFQKYIQELVESAEVTLY